MRMYRAYVAHIWHQVYQHQYGFSQSAVCWVRFSRAQALSGLCLRINVPLQRGPFEWGGPLKLGEKILSRLHPTLVSAAAALMWDRSHLRAATALKWDLHASTYITTHSTAAAGRCHCGVGERGFTRLQGSRGGRASKKHQMP